MEPLTYVAGGIVRDLGAWLVLLVALAAGISIPAMLSIVMNVRRTMRATERIAAALEGQSAVVDGRGDNMASRLTIPGAASAR